jgi:hypothetical protein
LPKSWETQQLLAFLDQAYDHRSWHGPNLRGSLRRVSLTQAAWRPGPERHSIWEILVHAAYWKYAVRRRLAGERRGSFPLEGSNWFLRGDDVREALWRSDLALLEEMHLSLRALVATLSDRDWSRRTKGSPFANGAIVSGAAAHDLYHAGQIQLLKRLARS